MKPRVKTLVLLTPAFPADASETSWVVTQQVFTRVLQRLYPDLTIRVLSLYYPDRVGVYDWHGIRVEAFRGMGDRKWRRIFFWRRIWRSLQQIRREDDVVGLLSFWCGEAGLLGHYFGRRTGIPHYCWLCGQDARAGNRLVRWIRPSASELIAMSDALVREFERNHGIRPAHMIPNGVDLMLDPDAPQEERDIDILGAGSLSPLKQYDVFAAVVAALKVSRPGLRARHCGSGTEQARVEGMIRDLGLEGVLELMGEQTHAAVLGSMRRARVFLHTSSYEGFGVVCMEALYAGAQVISFVRPMDEDIPGWHIVRTKEEMVSKALDLLEGDVSFVPSKIYLMEDTVHAILGLFGC